MKEAVSKLHLIMPPPESPKEEFIRLKKRIIENVEETLHQKQKLEDLYVFIGVLLPHDTPELNPAWLFVNELTGKFKEAVAAWQGSGSQAKDIYYKTPIEGIFVETVNNPSTYAVSSRYTLVGNNHLPR